MFNKQEKKLNLKKTLLVVMCFVFGLTCASLFANLIIKSKTVNNQSVGNVEAPVEELKGEVLTINWSNSHKSNLNINPLATEVEGNSAYEFTNTNIGDLTGGTKISIEWSENIPTIKFTKGSSEVSTQIISNNGYELKSVTIGVLDGDEFTDNACTCTVGVSRSVVIEDLDPDYTGTIAIRGTVELITYTLEMYTSLANGSYLSNICKKANYDLSEETEISSIVPYKSNLEFLGWMIHTKNLFCKYGGVYEGNVVANKYIITSIEKNEKGLPLLRLEFTIEKELNNPDNSSYPYYQVTDVKGYGSLVQDVRVTGGHILPIVVSRWSNKHYVKIDNSGETNNSSVYWHDNTATELNSDLYGVGSSMYGSAKFDVTFTITDDELYNMPFMTSHMSGKHYAFYQRDDFKNDSTAGAWNSATDQGDKKGYYVFNYGHEIAGYYVKIDGENKFFKRDSSDPTGWSSEFETNINQARISPYSLMGSTFQNLAKKLDEIYPEDTNKNIAIVPIWGAVTVEAYYKNGDIETSRNIRFGEEYSRLGHSASDGGLGPKRIDGQTIASFYALVDDGSSTKNQIISNDGVWNYQNIPHSLYKYQDDLASGSNFVYRLVGQDGEGLHPYYTNNIYKVNLNNVHKNESGNYSLANSSPNYKFATSIVSSATITINETDALNSFEDFADGYSDISNILIDDYITEVENGLQWYEDLCDVGGTVDFEGLSKIYFLNGELSGGEVVSKGTTQFWTYLTHGCQVSNLPEFEVPYKKQLAWENENITLTTNNFTTEYRYNRDVKNLLESNGANVSSLWICSAGLELNATYGYVLDLYYENRSATYSSVTSYVYGEGVDIDFSNYGKSYAPIQSAFDRVLRKTVVGWILNLDNARASGYTVEQDWDDYATVLTTTISDNYGNKWSVNLVGQTDGYGSKIPLLGGGLGVTSYPWEFTTTCTDEEHKGIFAQDATKPIILPKYEQTYLFQVLNDASTMIAAGSAQRLDGFNGAAWKNNGSYNVEDVFGIDAEEYYGAGYVYDVDEDFESSTLEVSKESEFPFPLNSGYAFKTKGEIAKEVTGYAYVYNYGYTVSGWCVYITGKTTTGSVVNYSLSFNRDYGRPIEINLTYIKSPPIGITYTQTQLIDEYDLTLGYVASKIDEIVSDYSLMGDVTVSLIPEWTSAEVEISGPTDSGWKYNVLFGGEYDLSDVADAMSSDYVGKSVVAFENNENTIVKNGLWQYIDLNYVYDSATGSYKVKLDPITANNMYRVDLTNYPFVSHQYSGVSRISTSIDTQGYGLSPGIEEEVKSFSYNGSSRPFMPSGIQFFNQELDEWEDSLYEGTDLNLFKLMYDPNQVLSVQEDGNICKFEAYGPFSVSIYLPYEYGFKKDLPAFITANEKTIFWIDTTTNYAYNSVEMNERYNNEKYYYDPYIDGYILRYNDGKTLGLPVNFDGPVVLIPHNVYSLDMCYSIGYDDSRTFLIHESVNTGDVQPVNGWFAPNTKLELQDDEGNELYKAPATGINEGFEFKTWVLDLHTYFGVYEERNVSSLGYGYKVAEEYDASKGYIKLSGLGAQSGKEFVFYVVGVNEYNSSIYYISGCVGNGVFKQDIDFPLIYATWSRLYEIMIDNTETYWKNLDSGQSMYGAVFSNESENDGFAVAKLIIGDDPKTYNYPFMSSMAYDKNAKTDYGISFFKPTIIDGNSIEKPVYNEESFAAESSGGGWYFVYNYGHYISGWKIKYGSNYFIYDTEWKLAENDGSEGWNVTSVDVLKNLCDVDGNFAGFAAFARAADEYFVTDGTDVGLITFIPDWKEVQVCVEDVNGNTLLNSGKFTDSYNLNVSGVIVPTGKSLFSFELDAGSDNLIALNGNWNYMNIAQAYSATASVITGEYMFNTSSYKDYGSMEYRLIVSPVFVDDVFKVDLTNVMKTMDEGKSVYTLADSSVTDYSFYTSTYYNQLNYNRLNYTDYFIEKGALSSPTDASFNGFIDEYVAYLKGCKSSYLEGIDGDGKDDFSIFKQVYSSSIPFSQNDKTMMFDSEGDFNFYIFLANNQVTGKLPVFENDYQSLILWKNTETNETTNKNYIYTTSLYDADLHSNELFVAGNSIYSFHDDGAGNFVSIWKYADGYNTFTEEVTFEAFYFRESYVLDIHTQLDNIDSRRGYVRIDLVDTLYAVDNSITDRSGSYIVILDRTGENPQMEVFSAVDSSLVDISNNVRYLEGNGLKELITVYAGCDITMTVYDQSKDASAMATGQFDEMIGYKFNQEISGSVQENGEVVNKSFLFATTSGYIYSVSAEDVADYNYQNKATIVINVPFVAIKYSLTVEIDNIKAGQIKANLRGVDKGPVNRLEINGDSAMYVQDEGVGYLLEYYAYAGFTLENNAFVYDNGMVTDRVLHNYNSATDGQKCYITHDIDNAIFYGTWLREYYYSSYTNYAIDKTNLGRIEIRTEAIEFNFGLKVYETDGDGNYTLVETCNDYGLNFELNESTATNLTPKLNVFLANDLGFWYYNSVDGTDYALISSRLYFVNNPSGTKDNYYTTYPFLLTTTPENTFEVDTSRIGNMVIHYESGVIIDDEYVASKEDYNRNIYLMIEVKKLYKLDMKVAALDHDTNSTQRTTTFSTSPNNMSTITVLPNALFQTVAAVANTSGTVKGYYFTDNGATVVTAYTYNGLTNTLASNYDTNRYSAVEYYLADGRRITNSFTVDSNNEIIIKYIPKNLNLEILYELKDDDGNSTILSAAAAATYVNDKNVYRPTSHASYYVGDYVTYMVECVHEDYDIKVLINDTIKGTTSGSMETVVKCIEYEYTDADGTIVPVDNRYLVTNNDFDLGGVTILVEIMPKDNDLISIDFVVSTNATINDKPGTFKIIRGDTVVTQGGEKSDFESITLDINKGTDVYVKLDLSAGYEYVGIKHATYAIKTVTPDAEGKILLFADFNTLTQGGQYQIVVSKKKITANLNLDDVVSKDYAIDGKKYLDDLYVEKEISLSYVEIPQEKYVCFYYLKQDGTKEFLTDAESGNALTSVKITSVMLLAVGGTTINFGVVVEPRYKFSLTVVNEELLATADGLTLTLEDGTEYEKDAYVDQGTKIFLSAKALVEDKYLITIYNADVDPDAADYVILNSVIKVENYEITMDKNYNYILKVVPKVYDVNIEEYAYETVDDIDNLTPTIVDASNHINNAAQLIAGGQNYNGASKISFTRTIVGDRELSAIYITGNDITDKTIAIEFTSAGYKVYEIVGLIQSPTTKVEVSLSTYNLGLELTAEKGILSYTTQNNINIRFDYKLYKSVVL